MKLSDLIGRNGTAQGIDIAGLAADSRSIAPGFLYAALKGVQADGADFIPDAIERGAVAVLGAPEVTPPEDVYFLADRNPRRKLAELSARFYGGQPETVVAITGTNGKSSVAEFTRQIWQALGHRAGAMGTLGISAPDLATPPGLTTPDPVAIHEALAQLHRAKVDHLAMEASSHGLAQFRLDGVKLKAAAFTSFSRDHLDYHATVEEYLYAKMRLFGEVLPPRSAAVLNAEMPHAEEIEDLCWARGHRIITVGEGGSLDIVSRRAHEAGQDLSIAFAGERFEIGLPLIGRFQALNALTAAALVILTGSAPEAAFAALVGLRGVRGRLEKVGQINGAGVYVDYAHTPDALTTVLQAVRPHTKADLHVLFGAGGDRDAGKRPLMGAAAADAADRVIVTDDNPRGEAPSLIRKAIMGGCPVGEEIADRAKAIDTAIKRLRPGDMLVIAGKGHEQGQIIGGETLPFDDADVARTALSKWGGAHG